MCYPLKRWIPSLLNLFHAHLITLISDITWFDGVIIFGEYQNMLLHLWYQENGCMTDYGLTVTAAAAAALVKLEGSCPNRKKFPFHRITNQFAKHLSNFRFFFSIYFSLSPPPPPPRLYLIPRKCQIHQCENFSHQIVAARSFCDDDVKCQFTALVGREK